MNLFKPNDVHSATLPLYYVSRLLGLASYRYHIRTSTHPPGPSRSRNGGDTFDLEREFQTSKCAVLYTGLMLVALLVWLVYSLVWKILYDFSDVKLTYAVTQIMTLCLSAATTVISLALELTCNRRRLKKVMLKLTHVDKILMKDSNYVHKKMSCFVVLELVIFVCLLLARHGYELWSRGGKQYVNIIIRFVIHFMSTLMIVQFVSFIHLLKQRFRCVNRQLSFLGGIKDQERGLGIVKMGFTHHRFGVPVSQNAVVVPHADDIQSSKSQEQGSVATSIFISDTETGNLPSTSSSSKFRSPCRPHDVDTIHTLRCIHTILFDIGGLVNSVYGIQLLLAMAYIFMSVVKYFHVVMISQQDQLSSFRVNGIVPLMCVVSIHIANVLWVTASCNSACFEACRTTTLVNKFLLVQPLTSDISAELEHFSQQLLHSKLQFTAFGFFNLDFTFLYGFVGGATTYIVILLQFQ